MTAESDKIFTQMLKEADVPVTNEEMQERWNAINKEQGGLIQNDSKWSPFWRLISTIVTKPCEDLVKLLIKHALPNTFLRFAQGKWLDIYAWGVSVERKKGVTASGKITATRSTPSGELLVPAGTIIETAPVNGTVYRVISTEDLTIPDGVVTAKIPVHAEKEGNEYNLGPGYFSILPTPITGIATVKNESDWLSVVGADPEQDEPLRLRCRNQFSAVGQYHHDAAYRGDIASFAGIRTDYLFFQHEAPRGPGTANCFVMIESGVPTVEFVERINSHIRDKGNHGHGDDMLCFPIPTTKHDLVIHIIPEPNLTEKELEELKAEIENMVRCAFRENSKYKMTKTLPFSRFSFSRLGKEIHDALPNLNSIEFTHDGVNKDIVSGMALPILVGTLILEES
jgi:uncharacterized phage protein gp47/JayE